MDEIHTLDAAYLALVSLDSCSTVDSLYVDKCAFIYIFWEKIRKTEETASNVKRVSLTLWATLYPNLKQGENKNKTDEHDWNLLFI